MSQPLSQYFAQEAGEFLDQLDQLLAAPDAPDAVRFFRAARGVRGSAQIAGAEPVATVAERLEDGARALRDGVMEWSAEVRERVRETAADLRALVERHGRWDEADHARARAAAARWSGVDGGRRRGDRPAGDDELTAFVRREIGSVASELDRVLGELAARPEVREPLRMVLRRMRPVRGVAGMRTLAPVLEVLEGVEDVAHEVLSHAGAAVSADLGLLRAAREALRAAAASLAEGRVPEVSPELTAFRELRDRAAEVDADAGAVPVSRLFADGDPAPVVSSPMAPLPGGDDAAERAQAFVRMEGTGFLDRAEGVLGEAAAQPRRLVRAAREAAELAAGVRELATLYGMAPLAAAADAAAARVRAAPSPDEAREALASLRRALSGAPVAEPPPAAGAEPAGPPAEDAGEAADAVPVESLLYAPDAALREALALRGRIEALAEGTPVGEALDELFGLVELGLAGRG